MKYFVFSAILSILAFSIPASVDIDNKDGVNIPLMILPGLLFGLALIFSSPIKISFWNSLLFIFTSGLIWCICFIIGFNVAFIVTIPLSGMLGTFLLIKALNIILNLKIQKFKNKIIGGLIASVVGIIFFSISGYFFKGGEIQLRLGMIFIILFWQLVVGYLLHIDFKKGNYSVLEQ